jgi:uncharacterized coiled-coil DUF342 family protein
MLNRAACVASLWLLLCVLSTAQTQNSDSQTLRQILAEVRAIHEDMRLSESTQFLLAEFQLQQGIVIRALQDTDNARTQLNGIHRDQKQIAAELDRLQDQFDKSANPEERNAITHDLEQHKSNLAGLNTAERDWNATLSEMQQRLQSAQDKLAGIESELNSAIARLSPASTDAGRQQ